MKNKTMLLFGVLFLLFIPTVLADDTISACGYTVSAAGTYILTQDLFSLEDTQPCIIISSNDVILNGNTYTIKDSSTTYSEISAAADLINITIRNFIFNNVTNTHVTIFFGDGARDIIIENNSFYNLAVNGDIIEIEVYSSDVTIKNNLFDNIVSNESLVLIRDNSINPTIENNIIMNTQGSVGNGVLNIFSNSTNAKINNNYISTSTNGVAINFHACYSENAEIKGNYFVLEPQSAILMWNCALGNETYYPLESLFNNGVIANNYIINSTEPAFDGYYEDANGYWQYYGYNFNQVGIILTGTNLNVYNNSVSFIDGSAFSIEQVFNSTIHDNYLNGVASPLWCNQNYFDGSDFLPQNITFKDNMINHTSSSGITQGCRNWIIEENIFDNVDNPVFVTGVTNNLGSGIKDILFRKNIWLHAVDDGFSSVIINTRNTGNISKIVVTNNTFSQSIASGLLYFMLGGYAISDINTTNNIIDFTGISYGYKYRIRQTGNTLSNIYSCNNQMNVDDYYNVSYVNYTGTEITFNEVQNVSSALCFEEYEPPTTTTTTTTPPTTTTTTTTTIPTGNFALPPLSATLILLSMVILSIGAIYKSYTVIAEGKATTKGLITICVTLIVLISLMGYIFSLLV